MQIARELHAASMATLLCLHTSINTPGRPIESNHPDIARLWIARTSERGSEPKPTPPNPSVFRAKAIAAHMCVLIQSRTRPPQGHHSRMICGICRQYSRTSREFVANDSRKRFYKSTHFFPPLIFCPCIMDV